MDERAAAVRDVLAKALMMMAAALAGKDAGTNPSEGGRSVVEGTVRTGESTARSGIWKDRPPPSSSNASITCDMSMALSAKPVVVLDWGWIRQRRGDHLPNQYHYLVPEIAIAEALGADPDPTRFADKLRRALALNQSRVFIAADIRHALRFETTPTTLVALDDLVVSRVDELDEQGILFDREYWRRVSADSSEARAHDSKPKGAYDNFRREFGQVFRQRAAERQAECGARLDWDAVHSAVLAPDAIWTFIQHQFPAYDTPEWRAALCVYPDRHAIGRFARLSLWQLLRAGRISAESKLRNDWEDIQYAFMASYSSQFWTRDRDLAEAVEHLFPSVRVRYEVLS